MDEDTSYLLGIFQGAFIVLQAGLGGRPVGVEDVV